MTKKDFCHTSLIFIYSNSLTVTTCVDRTDTQEDIAPAHTENHNTDSLILS